MNITTVADEVSSLYSRLYILFYRRRDPRGYRPRPEALARIIHHSRGASLGIRHHSAFASLTNTTSIRSVTENAVITNTLAIRSLSGELSRLAVMEHLFSSGPLTVSEAAKHFNRSPSAISEHIDRLVKRGLLSRLSDERDRRRKLVWLSPKGFALLELERQVLDSTLLTSALETTTEDQREHLVESLRALADGAMRARQRPGTPLQRKN